MENYNLKTRNIIDNWVKDGLISGLSMSESIQKIVDLIYVLYKNILFFLKDFFHFDILIYKY